MVVTPLGILMDFKSRHEIKALSPILVTPLGMTVLLHPATTVFVAVLMIALQFRGEAKTLFPLSTTIDSIPLHRIDDCIAIPGRSKNLVSSINND